MEYLKWFENLLTEDDFITSDKFLDMANRKGIKYFKRDFLFRPGHWRSKLQLPIWIERFKPPFNNTIFIGHADKSLTLKNIEILKYLGFTSIFGTNTFNSQISTSIPLGLTNYTHESEFHRLFGNTDHFKIAHDNTDFGSKFENDFYINFTASNNAHVRQHVSNISKSLSNCTYEASDFTSAGRIKYLMQLRKHKFVLCPEGNGVDTHRLWETLYMGGVPIIQKSNFLPNIVNSLPVLQLDKWEDLNDSKIFADFDRNERLKNAMWEVLSMSTWNQLQSRTFHMNC